MITFETYYIVSVRYYSETALLKMMYDFNIMIFDFKKLNYYQFSFKISKKNYKKLKFHVSDIKVDKVLGFERMLSLLLINKVMVLSLICSLIIYIFFNFRIYDIKVNGTNEKLNSYIIEKLKELGVSKFQLIPNNDSLKEIEDILSMDLSNEIDLLSINSKGTYIFVNYERKGGKIILEEKKGKMYAKKDAIIKSFDIESGKIIKDINEYVKEGDLLVDDTIKYKDKSIIVGTKGRVMGYTFNRINLSCESQNMEESEIYQKLLMKGRYEILKNLDEFAYIEKEIILSYVNQNGYANMLVHYTLVENIVKFS